MRRGCALALAWVMTLVPFEPFAATPARGSTLSPEYDLKAVFLFHFAEFVNWPADAFASADSPITIGVLGKDPFGSSLDQILANETISGRRLVARRLRNVDELDGCHILFVSRSEAGRWNRILAKVDGRSILTVGETKDFTARDGIIGFVTLHDRLRLRINVAAAAAAKLTISSKLLRQAELVGAPGETR